MLKLALALFASLLAGSASAVTPAHRDADQRARKTRPTVPTLTTGAPRPASFGTASFVINDAMTSMTFTATIFNIDVTGSQTADVNDNIAASHIHAGPAVTPTTNGPVVWGFFGSAVQRQQPRTTRS